jgi:nitrogen-specific signal transduction histidine kinase
MTGTGTICRSVDMNALDNKLKALRKRKKNSAATIGDFAADRDNYPTGVFDEFATDATGDAAMFGPDLGDDGTLSAHGWAPFEIEASEPGDVERFLCAVDPADREHVRDTLSQAMGAEKPFSAKFRTVHPVGQQRLICARGIPRRSQTDVSVHYTGVLVDITDAECAPHGAAPHAHLMTRMTHARLTHVGLLLGSLTHELTQPLMAILSNAQAGIRFLEAPSPDLEELRSIFHDICEDNQRAVAVIRGLRTLYQGDKLTSEDFSLNDAIREVARIVHNHLVIHNLALTLSLDDGLPLVRGHRVQIQQVLLNLIYNACEAMNDCPPRDRNITIRSQRSESAVTVSVVDLGKGIKESIRSRVFEPFFSTKPAGMGMGLDVCLSIVQAHGGKLWFRDGQGAGTVFSFTVPALGEASR